MYFKENIKAQEYKAYGSYTPVARLKFYYFRLTDNFGCNPNELTRILRSICKEFKATYIGVKSKGHGVKSFRKPHIQVILVAEKGISLPALYKHIPKGFHAKLWRIRNFSDFGDVKRYIQKHIGKAKRGFLSNQEIIALKELSNCLSYIIRLRRKLKLHAPLLVKSLTEVMLWRESRS